MNVIRDLEIRLENYNKRSGFLERWMDELVADLKCDRNFGIRRINYTEDLGYPA